METNTPRTIAVLVEADRKPGEFIGSQADRLGISRSALDNYRHGRSVPLGSASERRLAAALGVDEEVIQAACQAWRAAREKARAEHQVSA